MNQLFTSYPTIFWKVVHGFDAEETDKLVYQALDELIKVEWKWLCGQINMEVMGLKQSLTSITYSTKYKLYITNKNMW